MKRLLIWVGLVLMVLPAFGGCGLDKGGLLDNPDGGGGTGAEAGTGGTNVGGGTCFPGSKVCPDPVSGELKCLEKDDPLTSCGDTNCSPCVTPHATATCTSEKCAIQSCDAGWTDCNNDPSDGCETDANNDPKNCGSCGNACGQNYLCDGTGQCIVNWCDPPTTADCDKDKVTCEVNLQTDPNNCGFCGNQCNLPHAQSTCSQGVCVVTTCQGGWANCDGNDGNGCETEISSNTQNCGACGKVCDSTHGSAACAAGKCGIVCGPGYGNCDKNPDNGCEVDLKADPNNCNACGTVCSNTVKNVNNVLCNNGACSYDTCANGFGDCNTVKGDGCEINTNQNKSHCGGCGNACTAPSGGTVFCNAGKCAQDCGTLTICGTTCVNTTNDVNNCNSCNNVCPAGPSNSTKSCSNSQCIWTCNTGYKDCSSGTTCYNINTDVNHCGSGCAQCTAPTGGTAYCNSGSCAFNCTGTLTKCNNNSCVDTQTSSSHCGGCNSPCNTGGKQCAGGTCSCPNGQTDCSGTCTDTSANNSACGPTCTNCNTGTSGKTCVTGACVCPSGQDDCSGVCTDTSNNNTKCGASCTNCNTGTTGKTCQTGVCKCPAGQEDCNGVCKDTKVDKNNCGSCGNVCHTSASGCAAGLCTCATGKYCGNATGCLECCGDTDCTAPPNNKCCSGICKSGSC